MSNTPIRSVIEDPEYSCRYLTVLLADPEFSEFGQLILRDFVTKVKGLRAPAKSYYLSKALLATASDEIKHVMRDLETEELAPKKKVDVAIVTVIQPELIAAKLSLGIDLDDQETRNDFGVRFWEASLNNPASERPISVVLTMVGKARNLPCSLVLQRLFSAYEVSTCVLAGIAAGIPDVVDLGDVVAASSVIDYEGQRLEPGIQKIRPEPFPLETIVERDLSYFAPTHGGGKWLKRFEACRSELAKLYAPPTTLDEWAPKYMRGVILSGEKLFGDGSLPELPAIYHEKIKAVEQEGSGFAGTCKEAGVPWLIFRGISDFGDLQKGSDKAWQATAALGAATCVVDFIENAYRPLEARDF